MKFTKHHTEAQVIAAGLPRQESRASRNRRRDAIVPETKVFGTLGFGASLANEDAASVLHSRVAGAIKRHLRPELLNRISRTVVFSPLSVEDVRKIAEKFILRLNARLSDQGLGLTLDESVYALLMKEGYSSEFGARPMERAIEVLIAQPLAKAILGRSFNHGTELIAHASEAGVIFEEVDGSAQRVRRPSN